MKLLIVANWKNHPSSFKEARKLFEKTQRALEKAKNVSLVVAPPSLFLRDLAKSRSKSLSFAVQSVHWDEHGARTGEITLLQAKDAKASYVLVGHAERRARGETDDDVAKTLVSALEEKMIPILCVGERERKESGAHFNFIREQVRVALSNVPTSRVGRIVVAYEPLWAIGGSVTVNPRDVQTMAIFIRKTIYEMHGKAGLSQSILYGGSINARSALSMIGISGVGGLLVGHASTDAEEFIRLLWSLAPVR